MVLEQRKPVNGPSTPTTPSEVRAVPEKRLPPPTLYNDVRGLGIVRGRSAWPPDFLVVPFTWGCVEHPAAGDGHVPRGAGVTQLLNEQGPHIPIRRERLRLPLVPRGLHPNLPRLARAVRVQRRWVAFHVDPEQRVFHEVTHGGNVRRHLWSFRRRAHHISGSPSPENPGYGDHPT